MDPGILAILYEVPLSVRDCLTRFFISQIRRRAKRRWRAVPFCSAPSPGGRGRRERRTTRKDTTKKLVKISSIPAT
jgi:hypothetical protein